MTTRDRLKALIANHLGVSEEAITPSSRFHEDLGVDSLDAVELVLALESQMTDVLPHGVSDEILLKCRTVQEAADFLDTEISAEPPSPL